MHDPVTPPPPRAPRRGLAPRLAPDARRGLRASAASLPAALAGALLLAASPARAQEAPPPTLGEVLAAAGDADWRALDPENTLHLELPGGRVVIELAPAFAPRHVENVRTLAREGYFDGLSVNRSQDNYVVQWGDPGGPEGRRSLGGAAERLAPEFEAAAAGLPFTPLPDADTYAPRAGFTLGFPVGRDPEAGTTWIAHCYGAVGVARSTSPESGSGASLYVVTGHAPRHLDRNLTMVGRVVEGMEILSTLPRGRGNLGFYEDAERRVPIRSVRVASDVPAAEREPLELLRTDTPTFRDVIASRRHRGEDFFVHPVDRIGLCNVPLPVRRR